jgi:hypothetical protein
VEEVLTVYQLIIIQVAVVVPVKLELMHLAVKVDVVV